MIQVYKIMHDLNDMDKNSLFTMKDVETDLRGHNMRIHKEHAHLNIRKYSFTNRSHSWHLEQVTIVCSECTHHQQLQIRGGCLSLNSSQHV